MNLKIPELFEYVDLKTTISRVEFESRCEPILERIGSALDKILSSEFISEVTDVEMLGGALRVPKVKEFIMNKVSTVKEGINAVSYTHLTLPTIYSV